MFFFSFQRKYTERSHDEDFKKKVKGKSSEDQRLFAYTEPVKGFTDYGWVWGTIDQKWMTMFYQVRNTLV